MRESKFRAWYNGKMYAINNIIWYSTTNIVYGLTNPQAPGSQIWVGANEASVQEFTGLKDCKGKEIWEGDIVDSHYAGNPKRRVVKWDEMDNDYGVRGYGFILYDEAKEVKVIGNIYENSDLLETTT